MLLRSGSGSARVGPGMGPGLVPPRNPRKTWAGPGRSGWSGSVALSFVADGSRITRDARVTRDARIGRYRECRGKTRTHPDHPDPWRFSADFQQRRPGPNPDPHPDPPGPTGPIAREVPRRARAPPCRSDRQLRALGVQERRSERGVATPTSGTPPRADAAVPSWACELQGDTVQNIASVRHRFWEARPHGNPSLIRRKPR